EPKQIICETLSRALAYPVYALFDSFFESPAKIFTASASIVSGLNAAFAADGISGPNILSEN
ncbi:MAG TPA: hypothetical protein PLY93_15670, partial [Turneriella sp.]|nr:hypothetical protein [Turneriella sp.]